MLSLPVSKYAVLYNTFFLQYLRAAALAHAKIFMIIFFFYSNSTLTQKKSNSVT